MACNGGGTFYKAVEPPVVIIETPTDGSTLDEGVAVALQGKAQDDAYNGDLSVLRGVWSVNGAQICPEALFDTAGVITCSYVFTSGAATVTLAGTNPDGQTASDSVSLTINVNNPPSVDILSPDGTATYYSDQPIVFEAVATDTEDPGDQLTVSFSSNLDGALAIDGSPTSAGEVSGTATLSAGNHFVTVTVTDTTGRTGEDTVSLVVGGPNNAPDCEITAPTSGIISPAGDTILFEATVDDADVNENLLSVEWNSDKDGLIGTSTPSSSGSVIFGYDALTSTTHTITLVVTDDVGATCNDAILVTVGNAPDVEILAPSSGDVVNDGDRIAFQATASDVEDDATDLEIVWESSIDGVFSTQGASSSGLVDLNYDGLSVGTHTIIVTATDSDGITGSDSITLYVNGLPTAPDVEISPDPAGSDDILLANIVTDATDPDGDPLTYSYAWFLNGTATAYTGSSLTPSATTRGDIWEVQVSASDGSGSGPIGSDLISIGNDPPSASTVTISPSVADTDTDLTATVTGWSDADGDAEGYRYQWYVNGAAIADGTEAILDSAYFVRDDQVYVEVTPWDGTDTGPMLTSSVRTIQNSAPSAPEIAVTPENPETDDTLVCTTVVPSSDADGDAITYTYSWTNNGSATGITTDSVSPAYTSDGEVWQCTVTPSDGTTSGSSASDAVTVNDYTAPDAPVLTTVDPYRNEDTVTIVGSSEALVDITLYIVSDYGVTTDTTVASGAGTFTFSETLTRGLTYTFYATATDSNGNTSSPSNSIGTMACDPWDEYEDDYGYGDSCGSPVIDWATLNDSGTNTITVTGNLLSSADSDWYLIQTSDANDGTYNNYHFNIQLVHGAGDYAFVVYAGGCTSSYLDCGSGSYTDPEGTGYTEYEIYAYDSGEGHSQPSDTRTCQTGSIYNNCDDLSDDYYIHIIRTDGAYDCGYYELEITNGVW